MGIHFEHPSEITRCTVRCVKNLMAAGAILYSQSVFLKDVNDDYQTLRELFTGLFEIGCPALLYLPLRSGARVQCTSWPISTTSAG